jgi:long-chain fatty acid transport protein
MTKRGAWLRRFVGAGVLLAAWSPAVRGEDGVEPFGISAQARARGGADVAVGDSALSQIDNPATLSLHGRDTDFSSALILPRTRWDSPVQRGAYSEFGAIPLLHLGQTRPIDDRFSWGWAAYSKGGLAAQYHLRHRFFPNRELVEHSDFLNFALPLNLSYRVTDRLTIGGGIRAEFATARLLSVFGPINANLQRGYAWGGGFQLGALYKMTETVTLGVGYRSTSWMGDFQGNHALASVSPLVTGQPPRTFDLGDARTTARLPQRLNLGVAWDATPCLKLTSEVRFINYQDSFFRETTVRSNGLPSPIPGQPFLVPREFKVPFGYRDQFVLATGFDRKLTDNWTVSAGYNYASPLIPGRNLFPISALLAQHHISVGLRYEREHWTLSGGYTLGVTQGLTSGPSAFPGNVPGVARNDFANSFISQTQHGIFAGIGYRY